MITYLMGGKAGDKEISAKYVGNRRLIETAVATLATDRALLLLGVPGTAKSWVSEHLAAAVSGDSTLVIQCTAGTDENQVRYGWNYAQLLAHGQAGMRWFLHRFIGQWKPENFAGWKSLHAWGRMFRIH